MLDYIPEAYQAEAWIPIRDQGVKWLQEVLALDTTNPPGNEILVAKWLTKILEEHGVSSQCFCADEQRPNLVARLEAPAGKAGHDPMLLTAHMDVVPHDPAFWTQDAFGGTEVDGWIYGRGAVDMKYMLVENLVTFLQLAKHREKLTRDVIFLALSDEEAGCDFGARFMVDHHPQTIEAKWGINELGGFPIHVMGKHKVYLVQVAEKGLVWADIHIPGSPGHGSVMQNDNPVSKAAKVITQLQEGVFGHQLTHAARSMIDGLAAELGVLGPAMSMLKNPLTFGMASKLIKDEDQRNVFYAMTHNTANPTMMTAGTKVNVVPSGATISVDGRTLPGQSTEDFLAPIRAILPEGSRIDVKSEGPPYEAPENSELMSTIRNVLGKVDPGVPVVPYLMTGFSDSKWLGKLGAQMYGFAPVHFPPDVSLTKLVHGHDERIPVDGFSWGMAVHLQTVTQFCQNQS